MENTSCIHNNINYYIKTYWINSHLVNNISKNQSGGCCHVEPSLIVTKSSQHQQATLECNQTQLLKTIQFSRRIYVSVTWTLTCWSPSPWAGELKITPVTTSTTGQKCNMLLWHHLMKNALCAGWFEFCFCFSESNVVVVAAFWKYFACVQIYSWSRHKFWCFVEH